ncbi:small, acid-soluble spore protein K [Evansella cellulosilytica]|uniref:Small, acid-soluble spore protein K n=1 Tax=Evansella cellulosilytica (strain ATCC 21833 / DSM 2522 / FERM P-1141 / JCM 9156 / N-4) TaxID=649639 RepID=E6U1Z3_EVAC2|nr:small, acid-soluble spore protein K [Evansella cellulosilytica]ADU29237.1 small, acid-soluble spore protein K [Evansella cellulosilytica DSM 2522]
MRNKEKGFPPRISLDGEPRAKAAYASKRADGSINDHPAERMQASTQSRKHDPGE